MREESQAIVRFQAGWIEDGTSDAGLPRYRETVQIIKAVPPYTVLPPTEATEADFDEFSGPYALFLKEQGALAQKPGAVGFPLALWPVVNPAQLKALVHHDVTTIEQLAKLRDPDLPGEFKELVERAKQTLTLMSNIGKFEAMIRDRDGQLAALSEQVIELRSTISAQNALINTLRMQQPLPQVA